MPRDRARAQAGRHGADLGFRQDRLLPEGLRRSRTEGSPHWDESALISAIANRAGGKAARCKMNASLRAVTSCHAAQHLLYRFSPIELLGQLGSGLEQDAYRARIIALLRMPAVHRSVHGPIQWRALVFVIGVFNRGMVLH